jgi:hypothetical protein
MATAELAVAMPAAVLVLAVGLSALATAVDQLRCVDAARAGARLLARGEGIEHATAVSRQLAPDGATVTATVSGAQAHVAVEASPAEALAWLGADIRPQSVAVAALESADMGTAP